MSCVMLTGCEDNTFLSRYLINYYYIVYSELPNQLWLPDSSSAAGKIRESLANETKTILKLFYTLPPQNAAANIKLQ